MHDINIIRTTKKRKKKLPKITNIKQRKKYENRIQSKLN